jgi:hypothetical protein
MGRPFLEPVLELLNRIFRSADQHFNPAVRQVACMAA